MKDEYILVLTTTDTEENAVKISKALLSEKLIASAQLNQKRSMYFWNGEKRDHMEYEVACYSVVGNTDAIEKIIESHHNYAVPQIVFLPIARASDKFGKWIIDSCSEPGETS